MLQEQATARAVSAESSLQSLSTQLKLEHEVSQHKAGLLSSLFTNLAQTTAALQTSPSADQSEPCSLNRQLTTGLPDQAMAQLVVSHVQALVSTDASQKQQLASLSGQLERLLTERSKAAKTLTAALHGRNSSKDADEAVSHADTAAQSGPTAESQAAELPQGTDVTQLAASASTVIKECAVQLTQKDSQLQQVLHQLMLTQQERTKAEGKVQAALQQAQAANDQLQSLQRSAQQVDSLCPDPAQLSPSVLVALVKLCG